MKKQTGIWIDGSKAIIVSLDKGKETILEIEAHIENKGHHQHEGDKGSFMGTHHINNEQKFNERRIQQTDAFLKNVINEVKGSDEIFVLGPSTFKTRLTSKMQAASGFTPRVTGLESSDYITLNQCVARVKEFFKSQEK
jgi:hypothetical protein